MRSGRMMLGQAALLAVASMAAVSVRRAEDMAGEADAMSDVLVVRADEDAAPPAETRQQRCARERREVKAGRRKSK